MHVASREDARRLRWPGIGLFWPLLGIAVLLYAAHEDLGLGGSGTDTLFKQWVNDGLLWAAAAGCLAGALRSTKSRVAWLLVAAALASWGHRRHDLEIRGHPALRDRGQRTSLTSKRVLVQLNVQRPRLPMMVLFVWGKQL